MVSEAGQNLLLSSTTFAPLDWRMYLPIAFQQLHPWLQRWKDVERLTRVYYYLRHFPEICYTLEHWIHIATPSKCQAPAFTVIFMLRFGVETDYTARSDWTNWLINGLRSSSIHIHGTIHGTPTVHSMDVLPQTMFKSKLRTTHTGFPAKIGAILPYPRAFLTCNPSVALSCRGPRRPLQSFMVDHHRHGSTNHKQKHGLKMAAPSKLQQQGATKVPHTFCANLILLQNDCLNRVYMSSYMEYSRVTWLRIAGPIRGWGIPFYGAIHTGLTWPCNGGKPNCLPHTHLNLTCMYNIQIICVFRTNTNDFMMILYSG